MVAPRVALRVVLWGYIEVAMLAELLAYTTDEKMAVDWAVKKDRLQVVCLGHCLVDD